jgi:hypothetical protein
MINYTIINSAVNYVTPEPMDKEVLTIIHNAGHFSNCTIGLQDIMGYYNKKGRLPDEIDRSQQWIHYKGVPSDRPDLNYFEITDTPIMLPPVIDTPYVYDCMAFQFQPYKNIKLEQVLPLVNKYFNPSKLVKDKLAAYEAKYNLDYNNLCAVFYRGNDKVTEMNVSPYDLFINKAKEVKAQNPDIKFLVQPDETEFLHAFLDMFPDSIYFTETPHLSKQMSAVFFETKLQDRQEYGAKFLAATLALSKCNTLITHSGNCGLWATLYRGHTNNLHQIFNNEWL